MGKHKSNKKDEGVLPPQSVPVSVCGGVEAYNKSTPSASDSLGNTIPPGVIEDPGNARADFPNASEERNLRYISRHSRVLFKRIPGMQGIWRVASSYRLKTTEPTHRCSSLSHAHHKLSAEYPLKRRLRVQNRSAGCVLSVSNISTQQEVPSFCLRKQGIPVSSTSLQSEHCPHVLTCLGHTVAAYLHHQEISVIPYRNDWLINHPHRQVLLHHQSQLLNILNMVGLRLNEAKSELEPVQDIQFLGLPLVLDQGRASLPVSKAREIWHTSCRISSQKTLSYREVSQFMGSLNWASGLIPLGHLHFHSLGLTNQFSTPWHSDPVTLLRQWQDLSFLTSGIPI